METRSRQVRLTDAARKLEVSLDHFGKSGQGLVVLNFFVLDGTVLEKSPRDKPFYLAFEKLRFSTDPGYFAQVQIVVEIRGEPDEAEDTAIELLEEAAHYIFLHF